MTHAITIWTGPSAYTSNPITVTAALGGNTGTGRVIDLTIAPVAVAEAVRAYDGPGGQRGGVYVKALRDSIDDALVSSPPFTGVDVHVERQVLPAIGAQQ